MGTNFYFRNKEEWNKLTETSIIIANKINEIMNQICEIVKDENDLMSIRWKLEDAAHVNCEEIHIGKRSAGWKPSFERQEGLFGSVREMKKFYEENKNIYEIVNEYGEVFDWEGLKKELLDCKGERENLHDAYKDEDGYIWHRYEFS